jgi:hypothetical protein
VKEAAKGVVLFFGENPHDSEALRELYRAIRPQGPPAEIRREPLILVRQAETSKQRKQASRIASIAAAERARRPVEAVVVHRDCDAVEPTHVATARELEVELGAAGVPNPIPATPAWCTEAWWFLWPAAVAAVNARWKPLKAPQTQLGKIRDAKQALIRRLRPAGSVTTQDYTESDSPRIAAKVRELSLIDQPLGVSESFRAFRTALETRIKPLRPSR